MNKGGFCRRLLVHLAAIVNRPQHYSLLSYYYSHVVSQSFNFMHSADGDISTLRICK